MDPSPLVRLFSDHARLLVKGSIEDLASQYRLPVTMNWADCTIKLTNRKELMLLLALHRHLMTVNKVKKLSPMSRKIESGDSENLHIRIDWTYQTDAAPRRSRADYDLSMSKRGPRVREVTFYRDIPDTMRFLANSDLRLSA